MEKFIGEDTLVSVGGITWKRITNIQYPKYGEYVLISILVESNGVRHLGAIWQAMYNSQTKSILTCDADIISIQNEPNAYYTELNPIKGL